MKSIAFLCTLLIPVILHTQNINKLFKSLPLAAASCDDAFKTAELEWETETLDNDSIFHRAKAWAPGGEIKSFSERLDATTAFIERASENNSFSLSAPSTIDKTVMSQLGDLTKTREAISLKWQNARESTININADFVVPNELDNSCEQIQNAMNQLKLASEKINAQLQNFTTICSTDLESFQTQFDDLNKIRHPMVNNQALDELSNLVTILNELSALLNFHYKNMVESRMAWNNALCK